MGELFSNTTDKELYFVKKEYFQILQKKKYINEKQFRLLSYYHRINILFMIMNAGSGHIGTSFSIIDFLILFNNSKYKKNLLFSSKGHDSPAFYSTAIADGKIKFDKLFKFRKIDGLPGHPDKSIKIFKFNTGSLGMGISKAKGYLKNKKNKYAFVILGDGELQEGQIWESLNQRINSRLKIIIDCNKLQSDFTTRATSDIGNIKKKFQAFGLKVREIDGHNFYEINNSLKNINNFDCLILNTIKGYGVSYFHGNKSQYNKINYTFHSGAPSYEIYEKAIKKIITKISTIINKEVNFELTPYKKEITFVNKTKKYSIIKVYENFLVQKFQSNKKLVCLDADLLIDHGLLEIKKRYPDRLIECGIAEMDMISQASGIAENKEIPICHSFSCFMSFRALEQIYNNCSEKRKIIYTASLVGVVPSGPGHSHQAVKDFSNYGTIPNLIVSEPINKITLERTYKIFKNNNSSMFIRLNPLPTVNFQDLNKKISDYDPVVLRDWEKRNKKKKLLILTYGSVLSEQILESSKSINKFNIKILSLIFLNKFNYKFLTKEIEKAYKIVFFDNQISGLTPFTLLVSELNSKLNFYFKYKSYAINGIPKCGSNDEILDYYNFSSNKISLNLNNL